VPKSSTAQKKINQTKKKKERDKKKNVNVGMENLQVLHVPKKTDSKKNFVKVRAGKKEKDAQALVW